MVESVKVTPCRSATPFDAEACRQPGVHDIQMGHPVTHLVCSHERDAVNKLALSHHLFFYSSGAVAGLLRDCRPWLWKKILRGPSGSKNKNEIYDWPKTLFFQTVSASPHKDYRPQYFRSGPYVPFSGKNKFVNKSAIAVGTYFCQPVLTSWDFNKKKIREYFRKVQTQQNMPET